MRFASLTLAIGFTFAVFADEPPKPTANNANEFKQQYERQMKEFADSIAKAKDNPEEKEALEKARDEFKKAMEGKVKEAEKAIPPAPPVRGGARFIAPEFPQPLLPDEFQELQLLQQELLKERMNALRALQGLNGSARPNGRIGIQFAQVPAVLTEQMGLDKNVGVVVAAVVPGSAAEKAGLKANDILLQIQGKDVPAEVGQTVSQLAAAKEGDKLDLVVLRKGKKETIEGLVVPAEPNPFTGRAGGARVITRGMSIQVNNGEVTASGTFDGGVEIKVVGTFNKTGTLDPTKIVIKDGEAIHETDTLEKVPEKYKGRVEKLINNFGGARRER